MKFIFLIFSFFVFQQESPFWDFFIDFQTPVRHLFRAGPTPQTLGGRKKILSNILARLHKLWGGVKKFCQIYYVKTKAFTDFLIFLNINSSKKKLKSKNFQLLGGRYTPQAPPPRRASPAKYKGRSRYETGKIKALL